MDIKARVPGTIKEISAKVGDAVKIKQILGTMEAMKMTQPIPCPAEGAVKEIKVSVGDRVKSGDVLFVVE